MMKLEDFGPQIYAEVHGQVGSNIRVVSNRKIELKCGTPAVKTDFRWLWKDWLPLTTFLVSVYKDDKIIFVCTHSDNNHERHEAIVESLTFN